MLTGTLKLITPQRLVANYCSLQHVDGYVLLTTFPEYGARDAQYMIELAGGKAGM